jgi:hypothetical protein
MCPAFPGSDYYGASVPPDGHQPATGLPTPGPLAGREGDRGWFPRSPSDRSSREVPSCCPGSIATATPQTFAAASPPETSSGFGVAHTIAGVRCSPAHIHQVGAGTPLTELWHWFTRVAPSRLACRTLAVWQYRPVPALSGLLSTLTRIPGIRLPSASPACCDTPAMGSFHLHSVTRRLVARQVIRVPDQHSQPLPATVPCLVEDAQGDVGEQW